MRVARGTRPAAHAGCVILLLCFAPSAHGLPVGPRRSAIEIETHCAGDNPCKHDGTCILLSPEKIEVDGVLWKCDCTDGFRGPTCAKSTAAAGEASGGEVVMVASDEKAVAASGGVTKGDLFGGLIKDVVIGEEKDDWKMWDGLSVIPSSTPGEKCEWASYRVAGKTAKMCVHAGDGVSWSIQSNGRWADCDVLLELWPKRKVKATNQIYLELGANIGSCMMHMLMGSDVNIVAFEPNPSNLFCLTSTLMDPSNAAFRERVALFPLGAGDVNEANIIYSAQGNMGNSAIQNMVKDDPAQVVNPGVKIVVRRVDDLFQPNFDIPLTKMDVQGFECRAMAGMLNVVGKMETLKTEIAKRWLTGQGCSDNELFKIFVKQGFEIRDDNGSPMPVPRTTGHDVYDIVGHRVKAAPPEVLAVAVAPAALPAVPAATPVSVEVTMADTSTVAAAAAVAAPRPKPPTATRSCTANPGAASGGIFEMLNRELFHNKQRGTFIEFGAADGIFMSTTINFERELCWWGMCLEPAQLFDHLVKKRPDCINIKGAVCDRDGERTFLDVTTGPNHSDQNIPVGSWTGWSGFEDTLGGTMAEINQKVSSGFWQTKRRAITCYRLDQLMLKNGLEHVDYMSIDVQGGELASLKTIDFKLVEVDVIGVERMSVQLTNGDSVASFLTANGYRKVSTYEEDDIYVRLDASGVPVLPKPK